MTQKMRRLSYEDRFGETSGLPINDFCFARRIFWRLQGIQRATGGCRQSRSQSTEADRRKRLEHHGEELRIHLNALMLVAGHPEGLHEESLLPTFLHALRQLQVTGNEAVVKEASRVSTQIQTPAPVGAAIPVDFGPLMTAVRDNVRELLGLPFVDVPGVFVIDFYPEVNGIRERGLVVRPPNPGYD